MKMSWRRLALTSAAVLALLVIGGKCGDKPPETPDFLAGPDSTYQRGNTTFKVVCPKSPSGDVRFVMDWGDRVKDTTTSTYAAGDTARPRHAWSDTGTFYVKAMAVLDKNPTLASDWSDSVGIHVLPNSPPLVPTMFVPKVAVKDVKTYFRATTTDPDGNDVSYRFEFKSGETGEWSAFVPSGTEVRDSFVYTKIETVQVRCQAQDIHEAESDWTEPVDLPVGEAGAVKWWWIDTGEEEGVCLTSALMVNDGNAEIVYSGADDGVFYGIRASDGDKKHTGQSVQPAEGNVFSGHPAYCAQTQHIVVGNEDGEFYAFTVTGNKAWHWPGQTNEDSLTYIEWGTPAVTGNKIYVPRDNDTLYYFTDQGDDPQLVNTYYVPGIVDAPVVDGNGYVYFGTDSGYLYKMRPDLTLEWRAMLLAGDDIHAPILGTDGTVWCGSGSGWVFSVNSAGQENWRKQLAGETFRIVAAGTNLFVTTGFGHLYKLDVATGSTVWDKQHSTTAVSYTHLTLPTIYSV